MDARARAAMTWLIALKDDPSDTQLQSRIGVWCAESPANARAYAQALDLWDLLGELPATASPERESHDEPVEDTVPVLEAAARRGLAGRLVAGGFALALAVCVAIFVLPGFLVWLAADHMTGTAELRTVRLEDGTMVTLGADSALDVAFEPRARRVRLLSGAAFFDVTRDETRPFVVEADGSRTTVLGTSFEVGLAGGETGVAVASGLVRVAPEGGAHGTPLELRPGDWSRFGDGNAVERGRTSPEFVASWRKGLLSANEESVAGIAEEIGRYFPGIVLVVGPDLARQRVSGVYSTRDPVRALKAVADAHGAVLRQAGPWLLILSSF